MTSTEARAPQVKTFEWWMLANFAVGAGYSAFVSLLIPPFVKEIRGDASAAGILFDEFRDEVKPLVEAWLAKDPLSNPSIGSPFDDPSYTVIDTVETATAAIEDAEAHTTVALEARSNVGNYTLATVVFAVVLLLAGLSRHSRSRTVSVALGLVAVVLLVIGIGALIALPTLI